MRIGSSDIGHLPFTEYRFEIAEVKSDDPGPYTAFIGLLRTNEDGRLKFNLAMIFYVIYNTLTYYAVPGPVTGLTGYAKFYTIELSWSPPQMPNGVLTSYDIMYTVNGSSIFPSDSGMATSDTPSHIIANLEPQTTITNITITAHTQIGPGPSAQFSNVLSILTEPCECIHDCHGY